MYFCNLIEIPKCEKYNNLALIYDAKYILNLQKGGGR